MKRNVISLVCAGVLALALAGCSSNKPITNSTPRPEPPQPTAAATPAPTQTPSPVPSETPVPTAAPTPAPPPASTAAPARDDYHAPEDPVSFGMDADAACPLALYDARVGLNDLQLSFVPPAEATAITAFQDAALRIPSTTISYNAQERALVLTMSNTVLETGDPVGAAGSDDWVFDFIAEAGYQYPSSIPLGALGEGNRFFENAAVYSNGADTFLSLALKEEGLQYRIESGALDSGGMYPYLRLVFSEP